MLDLSNSRSSTLCLNFLTSSSFFSFAAHNSFFIRENPISKFSLSFLRLFSSSVFWMTTVSFSSTLVLSSVFWLSSEATLVLVLFIRASMSSRRPLTSHAGRFFPFAAASAAVGAAAAGAARLVRSFMAVLAAGPVVLVAVVALLAADTLVAVFLAPMVVALPLIMKLGSLPGGFVGPPLPTVNFEAALL